MYLNWRFEIWKLKEKKKSLPASAQLLSLLLLSPPTRQLHSVEPTRSDNRNRQVGLLRHHVRLPRFHVRLNCRRRQGHTTEIKQDTADCLPLVLGLLPLCACVCGWPTCGPMPWLSPPSPLRTPHRNCMDTEPRRGTHATSYPCPYIWTPWASNQSFLTWLLDIANHYGQQAKLTVAAPRTSHTPSLVPVVVRRVSTELAENARSIAEREESRRPRSSWNFSLEYSSRHRAALAVDKDLYAAIVGEPFPFWFALPSSSSRTFWIRNSTTWASRLLTLTRAQSRELGKPIRSHQINLSISQWLIETLLGKEKSGHNLP